MSAKYSLVHLSDQSLRHRLHASAARHREVTAEMLAYIAEFDERRLYLPAGYESMRAYCLGALRLSEDAVLKRTQAARIAREHPAIFGAIEDGRLHLSAVVLLAPHLRRLVEAGTPDRCGELLQAAAHKTSDEIRLLVATWFPRLDPTAMPLLGSGEHAPEHVANADSQSVTASATAFVPESATAQHTPAQASAVDTWARVTPVSAERFELRGVIDRATLELLQQNQSLLSHSVPSGNLVEVLRRALAESLRQLEKDRFRSSGRARQTRRRRDDSTRHIPKHVRDAVWRRDRAQCAFVGEDGHRCGSRTRLEFDHIMPVAKGGKSTVDNVRLLCDPHNQFEADRALGAEFMRHKREGAGAVAERDQIEAPVVGVAATNGSVLGVPATAPIASVPATSVPATSVPATTPGHIDWIDVSRARMAATEQPAPSEPDVASVLRKLGMRADRARELAKVCDTIPEAPLEQRVRVALSFHGSRLAKPVGNASAA